MKNSRFLIIVLVLFLGCNSDDDNNVGDSSEFTLRADYLFETGEEPELSLVLEESSTEIQIQDNPEIDFDSGRIFFKFNGVTIKDGRDVYKVNGIEPNFEVSTQRFQNNAWNDDNENSLSISNSQSLDVVLVLDVSQSLGENLELIKQRALEFVNTIFQQNPTAKVGIVKFSRKYQFLELTNSYFEIQSFILNNSQIQDDIIGNYILENRPETGLYEAMDKGIDLLNESISDGKGLVTFTDGFNNYQTDENFENSNYTQQRLNNSDLSSYTIGFIGNQNTVETQVLESLAVNGNFAFPQTTEELTDVFNLFSNSVAVVYDFIYETNDSNQNSITKYRFLINTTLVSN